jgi:hypothetical protein
MDVENRHCGVLGVFKGSDTVNTNDNAINACNTTMDHCRLVAVSSGKCHCMFGKPIHTRG